MTKWLLKSLKPILFDIGRVDRNTTNMEDSDSIEDASDTRTASGYATGEKARRLEQPKRYKYFSAEELYSVLECDPTWTVADLGSGTGFYTDDVAQTVESVYAVDLHTAMHDAYREKGVPENVALLQGDVAHVPISDGAVDAALSIRTFHHGVSEALGEVSRILRPGGRLVVMDWSATGRGDRDQGPDPIDCFDPAEAQALLLDAGFEIQQAIERRETFVIVASTRS